MESGEKNGTTNGQRKRLLATKPRGESSSKHAFFCFFPPFNASNCVRSGWLVIFPWQKSDFNQYWYSSHTIKALAQEVVGACEIDVGGAAFLSTPSIYFSLPANVRQRSKLFDLDEKWQSDPGFEKYDYQFPDQIRADLHHSFEMVIIDPPFVTKEVWEKYAEAAQLLLQPGGKIIASTILENSPLMKEMLGLAPQLFLPSIPNLVYQYRLFANFDTVHLSVQNPELPLSDAED